MKHFLLSHHPLLIPFSLLGAGWGPIAFVVPSDVRWVIYAFAFNGIVTVGAAWLLLRQYIGHLIMGSQGYAEVASTVRKLERLHAQELLKLAKEEMEGRHG